MDDEKTPMPADGSGTDMAPRDDAGELASRRDEHMAGGVPNTGESGGGAYPNPHTGKEGEPDGPDKALGHGGQGNMGYYGKGQLGSKDVGENENAPAKDD